MCKLWGRKVGLLRGREDIYVFVQSFWEFDVQHFEAAVIDRPHQTNFRNQVWQFEVTIYF
jgi:hypothetical protein